MTNIIPVPQKYDFTVLQAHKARRVLGQYRIILSADTAERGAADAKPKAQIILDAAKVSAASGGNSEPKQGQRSQSARGFCPRSTMRVPQPDIIEHFGNADAVPQPPKRCLSRKAGIVRCCLRMKAQHAARFGIYLSGWSCWHWALTGWWHRPLYRYHAPSARGPDGILPT